MTRYVVLDTETTGVDPQRDRVVWVALAVIIDDVVTERWSTLLDPAPRNRRRAAGVDLAGQPTFFAIEPRLTEFLSGGVLVAHNTPFDLAFLNAEYARVNLVMPTVPTLCTMRLANRLELDVASFSLVDCCAHFGIEHQRCHRADEDVEATVQLLQQLLPLAAARGWTTSDSMIEAIAPKRHSADLTYTITVDLDEMIGKHLVEKAGWRPGEESPEDAWRRYGAQLRADRAAAYARMSPEHRAAHEMKDALDSGESRASTWLPVLQALEAAECPETADVWLEYGRRVQGPKRNARRALDALRRALDLYLSSSSTTRATLDEAVTWISITCDEANLTDALIETYCSYGLRMIALPQCGECGDTTSGCLGGQPCKRGNLAIQVAYAPFNVVLDSDEDPAVVERQARAVLPILVQERDLTPYVRLGSLFGRRLVTWGRAEEALALWRDVVSGCVGHDVPNIAEEANRLAGQFSTVKRYEDAIAVAGPAVERARQHPEPEVFWRVADDAGYYLERAGRLNDAIRLWQEAVDAGSDIPNTFDRLSLALDRAGDPVAALRICEVGLKRFSPHVRRYKYVQQIEKRAERCGVKVAQARALS